MNILKQLRLKEFINDVSEDIMNSISEEDIGIERDKKILKGARRLSSDCYAEANILRILNNGDYVILYGGYAIIPKNEKQLREINNINKIGWVYSINVKKQNNELHVDKIIIMVGDKLIEYDPHNILHFFEESNLSYKSIW